MVLVDSSIWIEALRRAGDLHVKVGLEGLLEVYEAQYCSPVRLEVLGGARREDRKRLAFYFSCIPYVEASEADFDQAVQNGGVLRDLGHTVPWNDVLIASIAQRAGSRIYACDAHFQVMAGPLKLRLYQPGYGGSYNPG